jgi:hypothetical protein
VDDDPLALAMEAADKHRTRDEHGCVHCNERWPCLTVRLASAVRNLSSELHGVRRVWNR